MGHTLGYQPALDGVRALSIALVLAFHLGAPWMEGGYLGVSVFFTLSGFLITSLLLRERATTGRIDVRAFYVRRLRRLLPASLLCLAGIAVLASIGTIAVRSDLRGGVIAAMFQVANWHALLGEQSYADLFAAQSPVDHFWSLAIEEQFYWVWPLAIAGLTAVAARRAGERTVATALTVAFVVLGVAAFVTARTLGGDAAYFASWARFAEIVAGAALAAAVARRAVPGFVGALAAPALLVILALSVVTPAGRGWAYEGGLPLFALVSVALIAALQVDGPVARLLSIEPIPFVGRISYGLYLFHWPVFTIMGESSVVEQLAVTAGLTLASYHLVERPVRTGRVLVGSAAYVRSATAAFVAVAVAVAVLVPAVQEPARTTEPVVISARSEVVAVATPAPTPAAPAAAVPDAATATVPAPEPVPPAVAPEPAHAVVAVFGDSIADWLLRDAAASFDRTDVTLIDAAIEGCDGAVNPPVARHRSGAVMEPSDDCAPWTTSYPKVAEDTSLPVDVALLFVGNRPIVDHELGGRRVSPCEDMQWYVDDLEARVAYLRAHVASVVLAVPAWGGERSSFLVTDDHLVRSGCVRAQLSVMAQRIGLETVDLADLLCPDGPALPCTDHREKDGVHVDREDAPVVLDWLVDRLV